MCVIKKKERGVYADEDSRGARALGGLASPGGTLRVARRGLYLRRSGESRSTPAQ